MSASQTLKGAQLLSSVLVFLSSLNGGLSCSVRHDVFVESGSISLCPILLWLMNQHFHLNQAGKPWKILSPVLWKTRVY